MFSKKLSLSQRIQQEESAKMKSIRSGQARRGSLSSRIASTGMTITQASAQGLLDAQRGENKRKYFARIQNILSPKAFRQFETMVARNGYRR